MSGAQAGAEPPGRPPELPLAGITVVSVEQAVAAPFGAVTCRFG